MVNIFLPSSSWNNKPKSRWQANHMSKTESHKSSKGTWREPLDANRIRCGVEKDLRENQYKQRNSKECSVNMDNVPEKQ